MTDLNDLLPPHSEWELVTANAINNNGNVIGTGRYRGTLRNYLLRPASPWRRTVVLIQAETEPGQSVFMRGGIDHAFAKRTLKRECSQSNLKCAMPIQHRNRINESTSAWKKGDLHLDWYGPEPKQRSDVNHAIAHGTPLDWTTNAWPTSWGRAKYYDLHGYGLFPFNEYDEYYWLLNVDMDCTASFNGWFEVKTYITNGGGWEKDIIQPDAPYESWNHFAKCGKITVLKRDSGIQEATYRDFPTPGLP